MPLTQSSISSFHLHSQVSADIAKFLGGKRVVQVPPSLGFGSETTFIESKLKQETVQIPENSKLTYEIELSRVSIPPS